MSLGQLGNSVGAIIGAVLKAYKGDFSGLVEIASNKAEGGKFKKLGDPLAGVGAGGGVASQGSPSGNPSNKRTGVGGALRERREGAEANEALVELLVDISINSR